MLIDFVRHGEPMEGVPYSENPGLSERGRKQAEQLGLVLADVELTAVISSPIERARETAEIAASSIGLEVNIDERLMEIRTAPLPYERSVSFMESVAHADRLLVVAHSGIIRHLIVAAMSRPASDRFRIGSLVSHASISTVDVVEKELVRYGDVEHLKT